MNKKNYSLWFMPTGGTFTKFSVLITQLANEYSTPVFDPHVTLVGGVLAEEADMINKTKKLALMIVPHVITLDKVDYTDNYFRALFVKVALTPEVQDAYNKARQIFPLSGPEKYMPHLSLVYGNLPENQKKHIIKKLGSRFNDSFSADKIYLYEYETDGDIKTWHKVYELKIGNHAK